MKVTIILLIILIKIILIGKKDHCKEFIILINYLIFLTLISIYNINLFCYRKIDHQEYQEYENYPIEKCPNYSMNVSYNKIYI